MAGTIETQATGAAAHIIKRPRLTKILDETEARIILLCAPAGYGKTTLAREWVATRSEPIYWYSGGPAMADVAALAVGLARLLTAGEDALGRIRFLASQREAPAALARAIPMGAAGGLLVLDDAHHTQTSEDAAEFLQELLVATELRVLITSRVDPSWISPRRFVYGEALAVRSDLLAFTPDEAAEVAPLASRLSSQAAGWPAVVGLAALRGSPSEPPHQDPRELYDFFAAELYDTAPIAIRDALGLLALGADAHAEVTDAVLGSGWRTVLDEIVALGFATRDPNGAFTIHPLLRDFLIGQLRRREHDVVERAIASVAEALIAHRCWDECLSALTAFPRGHLIEVAMHRSLEDLLEQGRVATVGQWVELASSAPQITSGIVQLAQAELALRDSRGREARLLGEQAAAMATDVEIAARGHLVAARGSHLVDDTPGVNENAAQAEALSHDQSVQMLAVWTAYVHANEHGDPRGSGLVQILEALAEPGTEDVVRVACARATDRLTTGGPTAALEAFFGIDALGDRVRDPLLLTNVLYVRASLHHAAGEYLTANQLSEALREAAESAGVKFAVDYALLTKAQACIGLRSLSEAHRHLRELKRRGTGNPHIVANAFLVEARMRIASGDLEKARGVLATEPAAVNAPALHAEHAATRALVAAARGELAAARQLVTDANSTSQNAEARAGATLARAVIDAQLGDADAVATRVSEILDQGFRDAVVTAIRAYPPLARVLVRDNREHPKLRARIRELLAVSRDFDLARSAGLEMPRELRRTGGLSEREREVLDLIVQGCTNREIAQVLFISESTAKVHVKHIFEKLGVHNRAEAISQQAALD